MSFRFHANHHAKAQRRKGILVKLHLCLLLLASVFMNVAVAQDHLSDADLQRWLAPQVWTRDTEGPIISLGPQGSFDDTHIFAPCVVAHEFTYSLWYCGSSGTVEDRVFRMGLATSRDGWTF